MGSACTKHPGKQKQESIQGSVTERSVLDTSKVQNSTVALESKMTEEAKNISSQNDKDEDSKEFSVCKMDDLQEQEMKVFKVDDREVLVVKEQEQVYAMGAYCTHFGAPLKNGIHCQGKVYCPWHGACFSSSTGDIEEFPGLDPIPTYPVNVDKATNEVKIKVPSRLALNANHGITKPLCKAVEGNNQTVVILGSGAAGHCCAETLRQEGFTGKVIIVTKEKCIPYDRTKLSKAMHLEASKITLRSAEYYKNGDIEIVFEASASAIDATRKIVCLSNGISLAYTSLVIATGGRPRPIPVSGTHPGNVFLLRSPDDANKIGSLGNSKERHVIILGSSFIGMEVAAYLADKAGSVTVIGKDPTPFANIFGEAIGKRIQAMHEEKGVHFSMNTEITEFVADNEGNLKEVVLSSGQRLQADLLVAGLGVVPNTEFLKGSEIHQDNRGFVPVDKFMRTNLENVYAAGDIAYFPVFRPKEDGNQQFASIGHWQMALHHGRTAALSILGRSRPIYETAVPFFWSAMYGKSIRYCGYAPRFDDVVIHGDLEELKFVAYLCDNEAVKAIVTVNYDPLAVQYAALIRQGRELLKSQITSDPKSWTKLL